MTPSAPARYPWYDVVAGPDLEQGDVVESCPVFEPESTDLGNPAQRSFFAWQERSVIVLTQSCDLVAGREKTDHVLLCALWRLEDFPPGHHLATSKGLEEVRRGNIPGFHMVGAHEGPELVEAARLVDFRRTWSMPLAYLRKRVESQHLRLLPPYREHLSQAFARYFMRVGLPSDIPAFRP